MSKITTTRRRGLSRRAMLQGSAAAGIAFASQVSFVRQAVAATRPNVLIVASPATPQSLDHEFDVSLGTIDAVGALYDNLLEYEKREDETIPGILREDIGVHADRIGGLALKGKLAESWEVTEDGRSAIFKLREGVLSNWGNELTAEDVRWTWERKLHLDGLGPFMAGVINVTDPSQITVLDRYTVRFDTPQPTPLLLKQMISLANPIYDSTKLKEVATADDPWARNFLQNESAGFGPYRVQQIVRGQQMVFEGREDYWQGAPHMKTVIMREVPTSSARVSLLQRGAVDIAQFLQPLEYKTVAEQGDASEVDSVPASYSVWLQLNAKMEPFDKIEVRQAVNYMLPQQDVLEAVYFGLAEPTVGVMPDFYPMFAKGDWPYDENEERARELLESVGLENGFETSLSYNAGDPAQEQMAILFQTALRRIGIELTLNKVPAATFYNQVTSRSASMIFYLDAPWVPDPGYSTKLYFHSDSYVNYSNYENAAVDKLIDDGLSTTDIATRREIYTEAQEKIVADAPWGFIVSPRYNLARQSDLKGFTYYTSNNLRFQDFYRDPA